MSKQHWFRLNISYAEYQQNYYGQGHLNVLIRTEAGLRLSLPAGRLLPFVGSDGIHGRFRLTTDANNRFLQLDKIS